MSAETKNERTGSVPKNPSGDVHQEVNRSGKIFIEK